MKKTAYVVASAVLSVAIHLVFLLGVAGQLELTGFFERDGESAPEQKRINLQTVNIRDIMERPTVAQTEEETKSELAKTVRQSERIKDIFREHKLVKRPKPKLRLAGLGGNVLKPKPPAPTAPRVASAPRPDILSIDAQQLSGERFALQRPLTTKIPRREVSAKLLPSLLTEGDLIDAIGKTYDLSMRLSLPPAAPLRIGDLPPEQVGDDAVTAAGQTTGLTPVASLPELPGISPGGKTFRVRKGGDPVEIAELDALMTVNMTVHEERQGGGVFRIDISPNPRSDKLRAVAKDIMFLIDCSTSISTAKLEQFKASVVEALQYLTKRDRFNVVTFRDQPENFFEDFVPVTEENLALATEHVATLQRGGMTDVFAGLAPSVGVEADEIRLLRPLNIFLMSDGKSTVKDSLTNEHLIREVVKLNRANVSIYSFSAGKSVNLFLLDFLAYQNRGMSLHEDQLANFKRKLVGFISTHADLIVADLKYHTTEGMADEIFPKRLPHLYRDETLSIYGRYPAGAQEIVLSLVGRDAEGKLEELIFRGSIRECPKATPRLALDWAAQNVFHLIALRTMSPSPQLDARIRRLASAYNLYIPY